MSFACASGLYPKQLTQFSRYGRVSPPVGETGDSVGSNRAGDFMLRQYCPLVVVLAACCAGVVIDRQFSWSLGVWLAIAAVGLLLWLPAWYRRREFIAAAILSGALAGLGGAWNHVRWHYFSADEIGLFAQERQQPACLDAVAVTGPRLVPAPAYDPLRSLRPTDETRFAIRLLGIRDGDRWLPTAGGAQLSMIGRPPNVRAGDRLRILGHLSAPGPASNPGEVDYSELARGRDQMATVYVNHPEGISVVEPASGWSLTQFVESVRSRGDHALWSHLSHERAGLAAAVLLGAREELDPQRVEPFILTGMIHVMVVAGLHVGVLAFLLFQSLRLSWIPRPMALAERCWIDGLVCACHGCRTARAARDDPGLGYLWFALARAGTTGDELASVGRPGNPRLEPGRTFSRRHPAFVSRRGRARRAESVNHKTANARSAGPIDRGDSPLAHTDGKTRRP